VNVLTKTLVVNAGSSAVSGAALIVGAGPLSAWLGVPTPVSVVVGVGLLLFAIDVARTSRNPRRNRVARVIAADVAWVIAAAIVIFGFPGSMSAEGRSALGIITVAVATYALLQTIGLRGTEAAESAVDLERTSGH
jgi:uncharacterized membrane protein